MPMTVPVVAIDDEIANLRMIRHVLRDRGHETEIFTDPEEGLNYIKRHSPQIVLADLKMPKLGGMELLREILIHRPETSVVLMTGFYSTESAVLAIQQGAADYLEKPLDVLKLCERVEQLEEAAHQKETQEQLEKELLRACRFEGMVGRSPGMLSVFGRIRRVAPHFRTVLITGSTGTGKELVAKALHKLSLATQKPFAVCNCSAIVESLFESELFGHMKGSFTGAIQDKIGLFEYANGGTVFLDEIGELPVVTQAKLLRVLQNQEIQRIGSPGIRKVDVRVIAATNRDLRTLIAEKQFREDLYYRLCSVEVHVPRLAERREDLPLLVQHFLEICSDQIGKKIRGLSAPAEALVNRYPWPGNVRELENALNSACIMAEGERISVEDFPDAIRKYKPELNKGDEDMLPLDEIQRRHILRVLTRVDGNKARAAEILGVGRTTLYRILNEIAEEQPGEG